MCGHAPSILHAEVTPDMSRPRSVPRGAGSICLSANRHMPAREAGSIRLPTVVCLPEKPAVSACQPSYAGPRGAGSFPVCRSEKPAVPPHASPRSRQFPECRSEKPAVSAGTAGCSRRVPRSASRYPGPRLWHFIRPVLCSCPSIGVAHLAISFPLCRIRSMIAAAHHGVGEDGVCRS